MPNILKKRRLQSTIDSLYIARKVNIHIKEIKDIAWKFSRILKVAIQPEEEIFNI